HRRDLPGQARPARPRRLRADLERAAPHLPGLHRRRAAAQVRRRLGPRAARHGAGRAQALRPRLRRGRPAARTAVAGADAGRRRPAWRRTRGAAAGFVENSRRPLDTPLTNNRGWKTVVSYESGPRVVAALDGSAPDRYGRWKEARRHVFASRKPLFFAVLAA